MQIPFVVDEGEPHQFELLLQQSWNCIRGEHAVRVELHALRPDRNTEIQPAGGLYERSQIADAMDMAVHINRVAVAPEPEMLERMKT